MTAQQFIEKYGHFSLNAAVKEFGGQDKMWQAYFSGEMEPGLCEYVKNSVSPMSAQDVEPNGIQAPSC